MNPVIKDNLYKPWKWKSTFLNLLDADQQLKENCELLELARDEIQRLTSENQRVKRELQIVLATIRVTHNLDRVTPRAVRR